MAGARESSGQGRERRGGRLCAAALVGVLLLAWGQGCVRDLEPGDALPVERVLGEAGTFPGQFSYPRTIDHDGSGVWTIDKLARVQRLDPETGRGLLWWRMPESDLGMPTGITIAPTTGEDGGLIRGVYVADTHYHRVLVYAFPEAPEGGVREVEPRLVDGFGRLGTGAGEFIYPTDVAVLLDGSGERVERVYVSEYGGNDRISVFDGAHRFLFSFGRLGDGHDPAEVEFSRPQSIAIDRSRDELVVVDSCNHRLGRFTLDGELLGWVGGRVPDADAGVRLDFPYSVEVLADSTVLVAEFGAGRLQRLDVVRGESLGVFGRAGRGLGELATPWAALVRGRETYVLDSGNNRVVVSRLPGVEGSAGRW